MLINMNLSSSRDFHKHELTKNDDSDDILSLNSWSDKINLSTSPSSDCSSSQMSLSTCNKQDNVHPFKSKTTDKQSLYPKLLSLESNNEDEIDSFSLASPAVLDSLSQYDPPRQDFNVPGISLSSRSDVDTVDSSPLRKTNVYSISDGTNVSKPKTHKVHYSIKHPSPKLLNYNSVSFNQETGASVNSCKIETKTDKKQDNLKNQRPQFFEKYNSPHRSKQIKKDISSETFSSLPSNLSEGTYRDLVDHNSKRLEHMTLQGKAASMDRLHSSQPQLSTFEKKSKNSDIESYKKSWEHKLEPENLKMKVKSYWNNFKYGINPHFGLYVKRDSPLYLLGKCYHRRKNDTLTKGPSEEDEFVKDFFSRIWLTYRINFYPIPGTTICSDCGWGCMLRSAQMLIAQCLITHYLTRDWRLQNPQSETQNTFYREILRWFSEPVDAPSDKNPFCLHHLVHFGRNHNKDPGQWYGPASVAYIFRDAFNQAYKSVPILSQLCVYVAQDCTVYTDDVIRLCTARSRSESLAFPEMTEGASSTEIRPEVSDDVWLRSLIILVPMRLGGEAINDIYIPCLKGLLSNSNCMGIIGGKPKHSLYFLGWQDDQLIYLDPHLCHDALDTSNQQFKIESYHCSTPRKLNINKMDPSCTVGFYIRNGQEFNKFVSEVEEFISPTNQRGVYPLFIFSKGSHKDSSHETYSAADKGRVRVTHYHLDHNGQRHRTYSRDSEEFVML